MRMMGSVGTGDGVSVAGIKVDVGIGVDDKTIIGRMVSVGAEVIAGVQAVNTLTKNNTSSAFFMANSFIVVF